MEEQVADLIERVTLLEGIPMKNAGTTTKIQTVAPEPYELLQPIEVSIVASAHGDFVASFYDANIAASGDNEQEAFDNLKSFILDMFDSLSAEQESRLGPEPARQLAVLRVFLAPA
jgi:predicted RNase H-like HicB family nuclease